MDSTKGGGGWPAGELSLGPGDMIRAVSDVFLVL